MEIVCSGIGRNITGLSFDGDGVLHCTSLDGKIYRHDGGDKLVPVASTGGMPSSSIFDHEGSLMVCDQARQALVHIKDDVVTPIVTEYESHPLKGPHSCVFDSSGALYFTDSGAPGTTGLISPRGSCFVVTGGADKVLRPLALDCLAYPTGIALNPTESCIYVCEQAQNRVVRFTQKPAGVFHPTVFFQFSGRLGPSAICCDHNAGGFLYVARPEAADLSDKGLISCLTPEGELVRHIEVPGPDVTSLALSLDYRFLYVTEGTTNTIYRIAL